MADPDDRAKDVVHAVEHAVEHPIETAKELEQEAAKGESPRTPLIAITGITLILSVIFVILLAITLTLYFVYGGK
jgi:nitrogen fixation/metabolism regulation signal transduction histidine kinase